MRTVTLDRTLRTFCAAAVKLPVSATAQKLFKRRNATDLALRS
jgi:hypothetical protein